MFASISPDSFILTSVINHMGVLPLHWDEQEGKIYGTLCSQKSTFGSKSATILRCVIAFGFQVSAIIFLSVGLTVSFLKPTDRLGFLWIIGHITLLSVHSVSLLIGWHICKNISEFIALINGSVRLFRQMNISRKKVFF